MYVIESSDTASSVSMQAATEVRKEVNELDNLTTGKAVDVLLNYETVKLFNNEQLEVDQYDAYLLGFQVTPLSTSPASSKPIPHFPQDVPFVVCDMLHLGSDRHVDCHSNPCISCCTVKGVQDNQCTCQVA